MVRLVDRFMSKVDITQDGCWPWEGASQSRYGVLWKEGRHHGAHRISYELFEGPIPEGLEIDHLCHNPVCVNPDHLEVVTHKVNLARRSVFTRGGPPAENAKKTHCDHGHPLSGNNLIVRPLGRACRECGRIRTRAYLRRKRAQQ